MVAEVLPFFSLEDGVVFSTAAGVVGVASVEVDFAMIAEVVSRSSMIFQGSSGWKDRAKEEVSRSGRRRAM